MRKFFSFMTVLVICAFFIGKTSLAYEVKQSEGEYINYIVKNGDTLWKISKKFNISFESLKKINSSLVLILNIGDIVKVPTNYFDYEILNGDSLWKIAKKLDSDVEQIKIFNNLKNDEIIIGDILKIPTLSKVGDNYSKSSKNTVTYFDYTVKSGDTLWNLAIEYGIPYSEILELNGLNENSELKIGNKLKISVHNIGVKETPSSEYGEYLDWFTEAQYVFTVGKKAKVTDFETKKTFEIQRLTGAGHADCEPCTSLDTSIMKEIWGGYSWTPRACILEVDGRKIACSLTFYPHSIQSIENNNCEGHFDVHFLNSITHNTGVINSEHQAQIKIAAGLK